MTDDLSHLDAAAIDSLPFGYIALSPDGTVRKYNRYEADLARKDPRQVLGRNFFRDVAPCTQVREFEGRFRDFATADDSSTLDFDFDFRFRHGTQRVRIGFVRSPFEREVIVTVNRLDDVGMPATPVLDYSPVEGRWRDRAGHAVVPVGVDFWRALDRLFAGHPEIERWRIQQRLGSSWGRAQAERLEALVQLRRQLTLREVDLRTAFEALSATTALMGLGTFGVDLGYRPRGLLVVRHQASPLVQVEVGHEGPCCQLLAGLHAGFLSHLSGRDLVGRELRCCRRPGSACHLVIATQGRLERLFSAEAESRDADFLAAWRATDGAPEVPLPGQATGDTPTEAGGAPSRVLTPAEVLDQLHPWAGNGEVSPLGSGERFFHAFPWDGDRLGFQEATRRKTAKASGSTR